MAFDLNDRNYQQLAWLADHLGAGDANLETWGGPLSAHIDPGAAFSPYWSDQPWDARFAESCRRHPELVQACNSAARQTDYVQGAIEDAQARRLARVAAGVPEGLA
jgi:hypothetical protein